MAEVVIEKGKIFIKTNDAMRFTGVSKQSLSNWKTNKGLQDYSEAEKFGNGNTRGRCFEVVELSMFEQTKINKKFANKDKKTDQEEIEYDRVPLQNGMFLSEIDIKDPEHIELAMQHPFGGMFLDGMKAAIEIEGKKHSVEVKKGEYIYTYELDDILSEFMALATNSLTSLRDITPIQQVDSLISLGIIDKSKKQEAKEAISNESDKIFEELYKDFDKVFLKGVCGESDEVDEEQIRQNQIEILEKLLDKLKG